MNASEKGGFVARRFLWKQLQDQEDLGKELRRMKGRKNRYPGMWCGSGEGTSEARAKLTDGLLSDQGEESNFEGQGISKWKEIKLLWRGKGLGGPTSPFIPCWEARGSFDLSFQWSVTEVIEAISMTSLRH